MCDTAGDISMASIDRETPKNTTVVFYSKPDCPLCDEGFRKVARLAGLHGLVVKKVDIEGDPGLFERYRYRIPVVEYDGEELGWGRLSERGLERKLERRLGR